MKGNLRAHWIWSDPDQFDYLYDAETRMRRDFTHNEHERRVRVAKEPPSPEDSLMPLDGRVDPDGWRSAIEEMQLLGELAGPLDGDRILRGEFMDRGFAELCARPSLRDAVAKALWGLDQVYGRA